MRVLIVAYSLHLTGGTERSIINLANGLVEANFEVKLISLVNIGIKPSFQLNPRIDNIHLDILGNFTSTVSRLIKLPKVLLSIRRNLLIHNADWIICFGEKMNVLIILSLLFNKTKIILSENYPPGIHYINPFWSFMRKLTYIKAKYVTVLTPNDINYFPGFIKKKTVAIPNIINVPNCRKDQSIENKSAIAIGRLDTVKRYDLLINAFLIVSKKFPDWKLAIWGDGPLKNELVKLIHSLNLQEKILLKGLTQNIYGELVESDFLILSSQYESFGYVICEAMSVGIPVISFDCPSGPRHIIRHNTDGFLIPFGDSQKLAQAIIELIEKKGLRKKMGYQALDVLDRFSKTNIISKWKSLLSSQV